MTRLDWSALGERYFETGIDRGVLFVNDVGYAWPGLISVSESPTGGDARPYYLDGIKYLNLASAEEFGATVEAYYSPPEFGPCDGTVSVHNGLFATQQPRKSFGFSYRTRVGNDTDGADHGYKIHLVYNALAAPTQRAYAAISDSVDPTALSWAVTTLPPAATGVKPTAHFVIDSRYAPVDLLATIEDILYGSDAAAARMPDAEELVSLFTGNGIVYDAGSPTSAGTLVYDGGVI